MAEKILVTGASGFIGSFLVEGGLQRDMQVWAGIRKSSSRRYLQDERITPAILVLLIRNIWRHNCWSIKENMVDGIISFIVRELPNAGMRLILK